MNLEDFLIGKNVSAERISLPLTDGGLGSDCVAPKFRDLCARIFEAFTHDGLCAGQAFAAAAANAELRADFRQRLGPIGHDLAYGSVRDVVANADDHGKALS